MTDSFKRPLIKYNVPTKILDIPAALHANKMKLVYNTKNHRTLISYLNYHFTIFLFVNNLFSVTGKSLSEALIFASTNTQYDDRLFIELQVQYMKIPSSNLGRTCCVQKLFWMSETISVHNMFSPGLNLEFSCIELVIQWTICCHIVG